jgi:hypothetical protein
MSASNLIQTTALLVLLAAATRARVVATRLGPEPLKGSRWLWELPKGGKFFVEGSHLSESNEIGMKGEKLPVNFEYRLKVILVIRHGYAYRGGCPGRRMHCTTTSAQVRKTRATYVLSI